MELSEIEGMAQALFEQTGDAMFLFDPETHQILNANSTAQRLSGFPVRELLHMTVGELFRSSSEEGWKQLSKASRHTMVFHSEEGYFLKAVKDDIGVPVNLTVARLHVSPNTLGLITARDVRRQHAAYSELKRMEAELRRVLSSVTDCLWSAELDETGKCAYQYFSDVVEDITGLPPEFFLAGIHRWYSIVHPEDQAQWSKAMARQRAGESTKEEYRVVWPDGASRWVREKVQVSRGTAEHGVVRLDGVITDISERTSVERALHDSERRFRAFMEHSPYIAFIKDADRRYLYTNRTFQEFVSKSESELLRNRDSDIFPTDVAEKLAERDSRAIASGQLMQSTESVRGPSGVPHLWFVTRFTLTDSSSRRFLGGLAVDMTELKRLTG